MTWHAAADFLKLISPKDKDSKTLFGPIKPTNPLVWMAYKGQKSFGIIAILYTYRAFQTLFRHIKLTNPSVQMADKGQSSFVKPAAGLINQHRTPQINI